MANEVATKDDNELLNVLLNSLYPGAQRESAMLVIQYCRQAGLDVMQKPVHIVPMWDSKAGQMRDVVMPGISLYRINASRTGMVGGISEPEFGPDVTEKIGGVDITYPQWCKVIVTRLTESGHLAHFPAIERWKENYATKGGKEKSIAPNSMWQKRPYAQLAKCAEAQALRKAFPESCPANTAEEMEGKEIITERVNDNLTRGREEPRETDIKPEYTEEQFEREKGAMLKALNANKTTPESIITKLSTKWTVTKAYQDKIKALKPEAPQAEEVKEGELVEGDQQ